MKTLVRTMMWLVCAGIGLAETPADTLVLSLDRSVSIALEKNPDLRIAEKEWKKARAGVWEAYSTLLPSIEAHATYQKSWDIQTNTMPNFLKVMMRPEPNILPPDIEAIFNSYTDAMPDYVAFSFGLENTMTYGATATQPLFLGGAGIAGVKMAYASEKLARQSYESSRQNLIYQTANAYYGCLLAGDLVQVQEEALNEAILSLNMVKKRYDVGSASGFEKMRAEVEVANLKPEAIAAKNNYQAALTGLRMVLGMDKMTPIRLDGELKFVYDDFNSQSLEQIKEIAMKTRPEMLMLRHQKSLAGSGKTLARSQFLPKLIFVTDYSKLAMRNDLNFESKDFSKGFTSALSLQIPIFTGFRNCKQYQKSQLDYKIALDLEKQVTDGIMAEVEIIYNKFQEAKEKYQAADESIGLAGEAMRLARLTYEEGASTQLDVLSSQLALTRAKLNYSSAVYEYQMARYQIRKVAGLLNGIL